MNWLPKKKGLSSRTYGVLAVLVFVLGVASSLFTYFAIDSAGREHILNRAYTMAEMLPPDSVPQLSGTEEDLSNPSYQSLKSLLMRVRSVNSDVRFIYLVGRDQTDELFFYVDSEDADSADYSPPGQVYEEAPWQMLAVFEDGVGRSDGPTPDRWGVWISGYAPIYDSQGQVAALLGIDLPAHAFVMDTLTYAALPLLVSLFIVALLLAALLVRRREMRALEQKAEFLSIASHEIRTPLTGIRWALEDVLSGNAGSPESRSTLSKVHDVAVSLIERINNLLDVTKLEQRGKVTHVEAQMRPFLEEIVKDFTLAARQKDVAIVIDESVSTDLSLQIDEDIMRHVFFNLLSNAVKYTKEGTTVTISYKEAEGHAFSVTDQGSGIPPEEQEQIWSGYHRAGDTSHIEGTGLGLYLVDKAVCLVGGTITLTSEVGKGSRFTVTLPR